MEDQPEVYIPTWHPTVDPTLQNPICEFMEHATPQGQANWLSVHVYSKKNQPKRILASTSWKDVISWWREETGQNLLTELSRNGYKKPPDQAPREKPN